MSKSLITYKSTCSDKNILCTDATGIHLTKVKHKKYFLGEIFRLFNISMYKAGLYVPMTCKTESTLHCIISTRSSLVPRPSLLKCLARLGHTKSLSGPSFCRSLTFSFTLSTPPFGR